MKSSRDIAIEAVARVARAVRDHEVHADHLSELGRLSAAVLLEAGLSRDEGRAVIDQVIHSVWLERRVGLPPEVMDTAPPA